MIRIINGISIVLGEEITMSRNLIIILVLLIPVSLWLNFYAYYKYGKSLIKFKVKRKNKK